MIRLTVTACDFTTKQSWLFRLTDGMADFYIMGDAFCKRHKLRFRVERPVLDSLDKGMVIEAEAMHIEGLNIVTKIIKMHFYP